MNDEYTKNLYKQRLSLGNYVEILKESSEKICSLDLINSIIVFILNDKDQKRMKECLELFYNCITSKIDWYNSFSRSDYISIITDNRLEYDSYIVLQKILKLYKDNKFSINKFNLSFLEKHFYNYALYKEFFEPNACDVKLDCKNLDPIQTTIYRKILKNICLFNRGNKELSEYLKALDIKVDIHRAIVDKDVIVNLTSVPYEDIFLVYPYQITNISNLLLSKFYLCSLSPCCSHCGNKLMAYQYNKSIMNGIVVEELEKVLKECFNQIENNTKNRHRRFLESKSDSFSSSEGCLGLIQQDFENLTYFVKHKVIKMNEEILKLVLKATNLIEQRSCLMDCYGEIDTLQENYEKVILYYIKNYTEKPFSRENLKDIEIILEIYDNIKITKKITFGVFVLLFNFFCNIKNTKYLKHRLLNEVNKRKKHFIMITKWIFEYYLSKIDPVEDQLEDNFIDLCTFLSQDNLKAFVEVNMHLIYPIIYFKQSFNEFIVDKYNHHIVVHYILNGCFKEIKNMYSEGIDDLTSSIDILVYVLLEQGLIINNLNSVYVDIVYFINKNIVKILFELKKRYFEHFYELENCVFVTLRNILGMLKDKSQRGYKMILPFIESFIFKGCDFCKNKCVDVFVKFFISLYNEIPQDHNIRMNLLFDFPNMLKNVQKNTLEDNLNNIYLLVSSRGYLKNDLLDKAVILFKASFGDKDDESVLENYLKARDPNIERIISKIYNKVRDCELARLIGVIPDSLVYKEQKVNLCCSPFIKEELKDIALNAINNNLLNPEIEDQDLYNFVFQEINKYVTTPLENQLSSHLLSAKYTINFNPIEKDRPIFKRSYRYEEFLDSLFNFLLFECKRDGHTDFYEFFKYGNLLGTKFLEFSNFHLFYKIVKSGNKSPIDVLESVLEQDGLNPKIIKFLVNLDCYTKNKYFKLNLILEKAMIVDDFYAIYLLETHIRKTKDRLVYNFLQVLYYKINDIDRTKAISSIFSRVNSVNLYFDFILDGNLDAARDCLVNFSEEDDKIKPLLKNILDKNKEIDFLEQCAIISDDLSEWKNIKSKNKVCLHFLKDCELVETSKNHSKTLQLVTERRLKAGDNLELIKCHKYLNRYIKSNLEVNSEFDCSEIYSSCENNFKVDFESELNYSLIRKLIDQEDYNEAIRIISNLLTKKEWGVYYELSELYLKQNKINKSKMCLKKILNLFPKTSELYKRSSVRYAEIVNSNDIYKEVLKDIKDSTYLYFLSAQNLEIESPLKAIEFYINSLSISDEFKFETIPRLFHIVSELEAVKNIKAGVKLVYDFVEKNLEMVLPFYSQIITRLNHKNKDIATMVEKIILLLVNSYPKETHWKTIILLNSKDEEIQKRTKNIISKLSLDNRIYLNNIKRVSELFCNLSNCPNKEIKLKDNFPEIYEFVNIGINVPNSSVEIVGVDDEIVIFSSLQAPKKITFLGSDGKKYQWLCKYKDDLRKDSRFMELNELINNLFVKNKMDFYIRTYEVIPFAHNYGIIEFIDGLISLKSICHNLYSKENISISNVTRKFASSKKIGNSKFKEVLLKFPPLFYKWFEENFCAPHNWYLARDNYIKSYAVMNIMGWFMGLGDRHADNILFDINVGDTVHVDLNIIFESAKKFSIPERVPFRLTQNIVDAFGVLGLEGTYTNTMTKTLDLFLKNKNLIISNLLSFVYDPLHEWGNKKERTPKLILDLLEKKLSPSDSSLKVEQLNEEGMSNTNLSEMYIGWLPFI